MDVTFAVQVSNDNDAFFVMVVVEEPSMVSSAFSTGREVSASYLGDSTIKKLPTASRPPITTCMSSGRRQAQSFSM